MCVLTSNAGGERRPPGTNTHAPQAARWGPSARVPGSVPRRPPWWALRSGPALLARLRGRGWPGSRGTAPRDRPGRSRRVPARVPRPCPGLRPLGLPEPVRAHRTLAVSGGPQAPTCAGHKPYAGGRPLECLVRRHAAAPEARVAGRGRDIGCGRATVGVLEVSCLGGLLSWRPPVLERPCLGETLSRPARRAAASPLSWGLSPRPLGA